MSEEIVELHAIVSGKVQGVGFRATAKHVARKLGLKGTVRNLSDATVEIYAQGDVSLLEKFLNLVAVETHGRIDSIEKKFSKVNAYFESFVIID